MEDTGTTKKRIVIIGGGTGTYTLLRGLKVFSDRIGIQAVVTMADSGGSTGRLRDEFGFLPVGDARMALSALAREDHAHEELLRELFMYRFSRGDGLSGHTLGNLLLVALTDMLGSEAKAIHAASQILATHGEVIPVTSDNVHLTATYTSGDILHTEHDIDEGVTLHDDVHIAQLTLSATARISAEADSAIRDADLVVLGPGDLYTSILANIVVDGVSDVLRGTKASLVFVANLMSRRSQTSGFGTGEYIKELTRYCGRHPDYMLVNTTPLRADLLLMYEADGEYPVPHTYAQTDTKVIETDLVAEDEYIRVKGDQLRRSLIRHDSHKLAHAIMNLL